MGNIPQQQIQLNNNNNNNNGNDQFKNFLNSKLNSQMKKGTQIVGNN